MHTLHTPSKHTIYQGDNMLVYAVYADKKSRVLLIVFEGAKIPEPSEPITSVPRDVIFQELLL